MNSVSEATEKTGKTDIIISTLKALLADEYVLMNKTMEYLVDSSSPLAGDKADVLTRVYQQLKGNVDLVIRFLRDGKYPVSLSIADIVGNTQIKNAISTKSKVAVIEIMLDYHLLVIGSLQEIKSSVVVTENKSLYHLLSHIEKSHKRICTELNKYNKTLFN